MHRFQLFSLIIFWASISNCSNPISPKPENPFKNINLQILSDSTLAITWQGEFESEALLSLDRKVGEESWQMDYTNVPANDFIYVDTLYSVHTDTVYSYRLRFKESDNSSSISPSVALLSERCVPVDFSARQIDKSTIRIAWRDQSIGEAGFRIDRQVGNNDWQIAYAKADSNSYEYFDITTTSSEIRYRIAAYAGSSFSSFTEIAKIKLGSLTLANLYFGTEPTFEVMTWNIEEFPRFDTLTVSAVSQAIKALDIDIIGMQEIQSGTAFQQLLDSLDNWDGYRSNNARYDINLAFVYNPANITVNQYYEIFRNEDAFPRPPLVIELEWQNVPIIVINNHFKAMGDEDSQNRRLQACTLLEEYIRTNLADDNVIVIGDLNDELTDAQSVNVFGPFLSQPSAYKFADYSIAQGSSKYWSYPTWPSHIDHILITDELFGVFANSASVIKTLLIENYMEGGWNEYAVKISDHRPVALKLAF